MFFCQRRTWNLATLKFCKRSGTISARPGHCMGSLLVRLLERRWASAVEIPGVAGQAQVLHRTPL